MHYSNKFGGPPIKPDQIRWKGEYSDHMERRAEIRKGLPFPKPKRKKK